MPMNTQLTELSEVASEIEDVPAFGAGIDTGYILAMAKMTNGVKILLNMNNVFDRNKIEMLQEVA